MKDAKLDPTTPDAVGVTSAFDGILADVLRIWDCEAQDWVNESPILFRFECEDLLVWKEGDATRCERGAMSINESASCILRKVASEGESDPCLCWRHDLSFANHIGRSNSITGFIECIQ